MSQFYVGVKQVFAWPEARGGADGYHVVYDRGARDEYHSWSPKGKFEAAYLPMGDDGSRITQEIVDGFVRATAVRTEGKTTIVHATLANGFETVEASSCVDPANYDEGLGAEICRRRVKDRVWHLLGFVLQWARAGVLSRKGA